MLCSTLDAIRTLGPRRALRVGPRWAVRRTYLVLARSLLAPLPVFVASEAFHWTELRPTEIGRVQAINPELSRAEIRSRLEAGQRCLLFWHRDVPVYYRWDTSQPCYLPYLGLTARPIEGDLVTVEAFTHPSFRNRGIHSLATGLILRQARDRGLRRSVTMVAWWNSPALRVALEKAERSVIGSVGWWGIGPLRHHYASGTVCLAKQGLVIGA
jgi:hypothetical protein